MTIYSTGICPCGPAGSVPGGTRRRRPGKRGVAATAERCVGSGRDAFARPLGGYRTTPRYPESARTAGIEGVSLSGARGVLAELRLPARSMSRIGGAPGARPR